MEYIATVETVNFAAAIEEVVYAASVQEVAVTATVGTVSIGGSPDQVNMLASVDNVALNVVLEAVGAPAIPEDDIMYAKRIDFISDNLLYRGEAIPGTAESAAAWRIRRITIAGDDDVTEEWANGNSNFVNVWDNRLSLTYS